MSDEIKNAEAAASQSGELLDGMQIHPLARLFPPMSSAEFDTLTDEIEKRGQEEFVITYERAVLDGVDQLRACLKLGLQPRFREWAGEGGTPLLFVWAQNLARRSLSASQRAVIAVAAKEEFTAAAKSRMAPKGRTATGMEGVPYHMEAGAVRDLAGRLAGVNSRYIDFAVQLKNLDLALFEQVWRGVMTLPMALHQARTLRSPAAAKKKPSYRVQVDLQDCVLHGEWMTRKASVLLQTSLIKRMAAVKKVNVKVVGQDEKKGNHMYRDAQSWNPFRGCEFDCTYCGPTFKAQAKRRVECHQCVEYTAHMHPERLDFHKIPSTDIVFVCGNGDISFCEPEFTRKIIAAIKARILKSRKVQTFYLQTKKPVYLAPFLPELPSEVVLVTTLETNRDQGYDKVSKAIPPTERFAQFRDLVYPRKVITIEPVMDFDAQVFADWILQIKPEYVWLGLNSHQKKVPLPEPSPVTLMEFTRILADAGIKIRGKELRGLKLPGVTPFQG